MKALYKQLDPIILDWNGATWDITYNPNGQPDFQVTSANNIQLFWYTGYFDLAGMTEQEKTLFIQGLDIQLTYAPRFNLGVTGDSVTIYTALTDTPMTVGTPVFPGFAGGGIDAQNLIFHRTETWAVTQDSSANSKFTVLMNQTNSGVCTATASDRIYYAIGFRFDIVKIGPVTSTVDQLELPGIRIKLFADAVEEKEYQYLMRLKRSYDLQQSFDVDGNRPH